MKSSMGKRKVKLAWIMNENARKASLKKRKLGLVKKVQELTILCDVRACLIIFSGDEGEPLVWPTLDAARGLIDRFFALPDIERSKKATNQESYLREKAGKAQEQLVKSQKRNQEAEMEHLMFLINKSNRKLEELTTGEIYGLISYSRDKINLLRKRGEMIHQPPLRDHPGLQNPLPAVEDPVVAAAAPVEVAAMGGQGAGAMSMMTSDNHQDQHYLMDQWIFNSSSSAGKAPLSMTPAAQPSAYQSYTPGNRGPTMSSYYKTPNYAQTVPYEQHGGFLGGHGSSSNAINPNVEMSLMPPRHYQRGSLFHGIGQNQGGTHRMMNMDMRESNGANGSSLVPMGYGISSLRSPLGSYAAPAPAPPTHASFMGHDLGLTVRAAAEGGSSSKIPIELGDHSLGFDLKLHPHSYGHGSGAERSSINGGGSLRLQPPGDVDFTNPYRLR